MKDVKKIEEVECDYENCKNQAVTKIETEKGDTGLKLCLRHEEEYAEKLREKIEDKYEGMDEEEIAQKIFLQGESLI
jgi:CRISPR/Cas system endoribonuclease Cas6 (RAMP superfamily)